MRWRTWVVATAAGAFVAWTLGMLPSTVPSLSEASGQESTVSEPSDAVVFGLAFLMGLVLGPVLGFTQWLSLRRFVTSAALWMPANALAWGNLRQGAALASGVPYDLRRNAGRADLRSGGI